jgi:hypothetical protein
MHRILTYVAFGSLTLAGAMHFVIDVVSHYLRAKQAPGPETTLYYALNTAYALGQVAFGVLALVVATRSSTILEHWSAIAVSLAAGVAWLILGFVFLEYWEPRSRPPRTALSSSPLR